MSDEDGKQPNVIKTAIEGVIYDDSESEKSKVTAKKGASPTSESEDQRRSFIDSEDAKETVVWFIIKFVLILCGCITAGIFFINIIVNKKDITSAKETIDDIKSLWEIFYPILTLALGYLFGKSQKKAKITDNNGNK
ncbi:hypothetical protein [Klebsiella variicola]|uniref:hypothetical protein n=1 Tax=Klebsiella variicola TaxID=244366 RepID=UPI0035B61ACE